MAAVVENLEVRQSPRTWIHLSQENFEKKTTFILQIYERKVLEFSSSDKLLDAAHKSISSEIKYCSWTPLLFLDTYGLQMHFYQYPLSFVFHYKDKNN